MDPGRLTAREAQFRIITTSGLPHAIQLVAAPGRDAHLLAVAAWCERVLGFAAAPPRFSRP